MNRHIKKSLKVAALLYCCISLVGCALQLAPTYNKDLVTSITSANKDAMDFLASTSAGTQAATFASRDDKYNKLIGSFEALSDQSNARAIPASKAKKLIDRALSLKNINLPDDGKVPSASSLQTISGTFAKMKDTDKLQGVTATEVEGFKRSIKISISQALTYENFLER